MPQPTGRKSKPAPRRRLLVRARRALALLTLLGLTTLVWGFMLQRLAARLAARRNLAPGCRQCLDLSGPGTQPGPSHPLILEDLSFPFPRQGQDDPDPSLLALNDGDRLLGVQPPAERRLVEALDLLVDGGGLRLAVDHQGGSGELDLVVITLPD